MDFTRCYGCMRELPAPGAFCPHCGYDNTNDPGKQPSHVLPCGTVLNGKFIIGRTLGQGGFGITYIGYDLNLEIPVCIKEYYPEGSAMRSATQSRMVYWGTSENAQSMKESRKSFVKEAQKAVKLRDLSHVVTVWDVFYENETAYIVMDYIEGETLKSRLVRTQKTLSERECVELLTPVMEDLEKAHKRGIIHRDIKPDNIMLTSDEKPVLLDMGAAKDLGKSGGSTRSSSTVVSQGFSPLEQYREKGDIGAWTDVYAMSATIYYCVTGKVPDAAIDRIIDDNVSFSAFTPAFAAALRKGLVIRPENRIRSMGELLSQLQAAIPGPGINREAERLEQERIERERREQERIEQERLENQRLEQERAEKERQEEIRVQEARQRQENERQECQKQGQSEQDRVENEKSEQVPTPKDASKLTVEKQSVSSYLSKKHFIRMALSVCAIITYCTDRGIGLVKISGLVEKIILLFLNFASISTFYDWKHDRSRQIKSIEVFSISKAVLAIFILYLMSFYLDFLRTELTEKPVIFDYIYNFSYYSYAKFDFKSLSILELILFIYPIPFVLICRRRNMPFSFVRGYATILLMALAVINVILFFSKYTWEAWISTIVITTLIGFTGFLTLGKDLITVTEKRVCCLASNIAICIGSVLAWVLNW